MSGSTSQSDSDDSSEQKRSTGIENNLRKDRQNLFLLGLLYTIQGVPLGFTIILPAIFDRDNLVSYIDHVS